MSAPGTRVVMRLILRCINAPYALHIHYQRIIRINPVATQLCALSGCLPAGNVCSEIHWFSRPLYTTYAAETYGGFTLYPKVSVAIKLQDSAPQLALQLLECFRIQKIPKGSRVRKLV
ncbi:hypothetical protein D3C74_315520 [compost metagenome]